LQKPFRFPGCIFERWMSVRKSAAINMQLSGQMFPALMMTFFSSCSSELAASDIAPHAIRGGWDTIWTTSFAKYNMPYPVHFGADGKFSWQAPYKDGSAIEVGTGTYLSSVHQTNHRDGSWEAHYYGANRFLPDSNNGTNCCCEYVGSRGTGYPTVLADYFVKTVPNSNHLPMEEVCTPYLVECPLHNSTASLVLGNPFIEVYLRPAVIAAEVSEKENQKLFYAVALSVAVAGISLLLWVSVRKLLGNRELNKDASSASADSVTRLDLEAGARKNARFSVPKLELPDDDNDIGTPSTLSPSSSAPNSPRMQETISSAREISGTSCMPSLATQDSQTASLSSSLSWLRGVTEPASSSAHWDLAVHPDNASLTAPLMEA